MVVSSDRPIAAIAVCGVIVGPLDLASAMAAYGLKRPVFIPQAITSGVLGHAPFSDGARSAVLGVVLHFQVALGATTVYYWRAARGGSRRAARGERDDLRRMRVSVQALRGQFPCLHKPEPPVVRAQERGVRGPLVLHRAAHRPFLKAIRRLTLSLLATHVSPPVTRVIPEREGYALRPPAPSIPRALRKLCASSRAIPRSKGSV